jgi:hypothetical protein
MDDHCEVATVHDGDACDGANAAAGGVLLVRRIRWWADQRAARPRDPALALSEELVTRSYRGLDGDTWPHDLPTTIPREDGLAPIERWTDACALADSVGDGGIYDCVILGGSSSASPAADATLLGYEVGFFEGEDSSFSSIFHECLHGTLAELRDEAVTLGDALLFSRADDARRYLAKREELRHRGCDLESTACRVIAIFGRPRTAGRRPGS